MRLTRRGLVARLTAAVGAGTVAGCVGDGSSAEGDDEEEPSARVKYSDFELLNEEETRIVALLSTHRQESPQHWHSEPLRVLRNDTKTVIPKVDDRVVEDFSFETHDVRVRMVEENQDVIRIERDGRKIDVTGLNEGETEVIFEVLEDGEAVYETPRFAVRVVVVESSYPRR